MTAQNSFTAYPTFQDSNIPIGAKPLSSGWWEWLPATIEGAIAVKNRSHNPKTTDSKLQSFFPDQTGRFFGQRRRLYETTPKWHGLLIIRLDALAAGSRAEQRTAEYRITNNEFRSVESLRSIFL